MRHFDYEVSGELTNADALDSKVMINHGMPIDWARCSDVKVFIGFDPRETLAFSVLAHSIWSRA
jgi:hypothetical protein